MLNWLKFTFGSFFYNKEAREGAKRSFWNVIFQLFMSFVVLVAFFSFAINNTFASHVSNSSNFYQTMYDVFADDSNENQYNFKVDSVDETTGLKTLKIFTKYDVNGQIVVVDTIKDRADDNKFAYIIDGRPSDAFVNFTVNETDNTVTYKDEIIEISEEMAKTCMDELEKYSVKSDANSTLVSEYTTLINEYDEYKKTTDTSKDQDYRNSFYDLYIRVNYDGIIDDTPTLMGYYQETYTILDDNSNYLYKNIFIMLDDWFFTNYYQDNGKQYYFYGFYSELDSDYLLYDERSNTLENNTTRINAFLADVFESASLNRIIVVSVQTFRFFPIYIFAILMLSALMYLLYRAFKVEYGTKLTKCYVIISSFLLVSISLAGITAFIVGLFLSADAALNIGIWSATLILFVRTAIFMIMELIKCKKNPSLGKVSKKEDETVKQFFDDSKEIDALNINNPTSDAIIIKNETADDDEKMELL